MGEMCERIDERLIFEYDQPFIYLCVRVCE